MIDFTYGLARSDSLGQLLYETNVGSTQQNPPLDRGWGAAVGGSPTHINSTHIGMFYPPLLLPPYTCTLKKIFWYIGHTLIL